MWALVQKLDGENDDYDVIPQAWLLEGGKEATFPLVPPARLFKTAMEGQSLEKLPFQIIKVQKMKNYDTFDAAFEDAIRLTRGKRTKSASENEERRRSKRKRKPAKRLRDSDDDTSPQVRRKSERKKNKRKRPAPATLSDSDSDGGSSSGDLSDEASHKTKKRMAAKRFIDNYLKDAENIPTPLAPKPISSKKPKNYEISSIQNSSSIQNASSVPNSSSFQNSSSIQNASSIQNSSSFLKVTPGSPANLRTPLKDFDSTAVNSVKQNIFQKKKTKCKLGKKVQHPCAFRLECESDEATRHILCSLGAELMEVKCLVKKLLKNKKSKTNVNEKIQEVEIPEDIQSILPLQTSEAVVSFEKRLAAKKEISPTLVDAYAWQHRTDSKLSHTARGIARKLFADDVLLLYSLQGGQNKNFLTMHQSQTRNPKKVVLSDLFLSKFCT